MNPVLLPHSQRGVTLVVGLIMLVLITLMVTTAFTLSNTNLKSVGNMQARDEAIAAANTAIEQVLSSPFTSAPAAESINVDINNDNTADYTVNFAVPVCIRASQAGGGSGGGSGSGGNADGSATGGLGGNETTEALKFASGVPPKFNTVWELDATVTDAISGTSVRVRQGVRVLLSQTEKNSVCP